MRGFGRQARLTTLTLGDRGTRGSTGGPARAQARRRSGLAGLSAAADLQRGHGRGVSPSKPSIRVTSSHQPHQGGRCVCGGGSSTGDSRAASTAYRFRTPLVFAPVKPPASAASSLRSAPWRRRGRAWPAGHAPAASQDLARRRTHWSAYPGRQPPRPRVAPRPRGRRVPGMVPGTVRVQPLHPAGPVIHSLADGSRGCGDCTPAAWPSAPGRAAAATLTRCPGN